MSLHKTVIGILIAITISACGQAKKPKAAQAAQVVAMVAEQAKEDPTPTPTPTPTVSPEPTDQEQTDQIPVYSAGKIPSQNASQNDCLPTSKIPCYSLQ